MSVKDMIKNSVLESAVYNQSLSSGTYVTIIVDMMVALITVYISGSMPESSIAGFLR